MYPYNVFRYWDAEGAEILSVTTPIIPDSTTTAATMATATPMPTAMPTATATATAVATATATAIATATTASAGSRAALPAPRPASLASLDGKVEVPLAIANPVGAPTLEIYNILGISTVEIGVGGVTYTVLSDHIAEAYDAVVSSQKFGGRPLDRNTRRVPVTDLVLPIHQPQVDTVKAEILEAFGVDTVDIVLGGGVYTVVTSQIQVAKKQLAELLPHSSRPCPPCAPMATSTALHKEPLKGVTLMEYYVGEPSRVVDTLAWMFGGRFFAVPGGSACNVLVDMSTVSGSLADTLERLQAT